MQNGPGIRLGLRLTQLEQIQPYRSQPGPIECRMRSLLGLLPALGVIGCSASSSPTNILSVGGTYQTVVTLLESTCPGQTVEQHSTDVTHPRGSATLVISHAGSTYSGTVATTGAFSTSPVTQVFDGISYTIQIAGTFTRTGVDARVDVAAAKQPPCGFVARWAGPKSGDPNVIP